MEEGRGWEEGRQVGLGDEVHRRNRYKVDECGGGGFVLTLVQVGQPSANSPLSPALGNTTYSSRNNWNISGQLGSLPAIVAPPSSLCPLYLCELTCIWHAPALLLRSVKYISMPLQKLSWKADMVCSFCTFPHYLVLWLSIKSLIQQTHIICYVIGSTLKYCLLYSKTDTVMTPITQKTKLMHREVEEHRHTLTQWKSWESTQTTWL